jgi:RNA polymerase sigma factor (sigma-70 family)
MDVTPALIESCLKGERRAEHELYKATFSYLMSICIRYTRNRDTAMEVLNIGFYRILKNLDKFKQEAPFKPWARKIMVNTLINEYKKEKIHYGNLQYIETYDGHQSYGQISEALDKVDADAIYAFINKLPAASKQVFNLYFIDGYKHREIAELLGISEGTSKWHLNAAREKLKEMLSDINITQHVTNG